jgi:hypothetical protein
VSLEKSWISPPPRRRHRHHPPATIPLPPSPCHPHNLPSRDYVKVASLTGSLMNRGPFPLSSLPPRRPSSFWLSRALLLLPPLHRFLFYLLLFLYINLATCARTCASYASNDLPRRCLISFLNVNWETLIDLPIIH